MEKQTVRAHVFGTVQGVSFRYHTLLQARSLGLTGWVRNCRDGSVETVISGPYDAVAKMREWLHRGPAAAVVTRVDYDDGYQPTDHLRDFEILY